eukprot:936409-Pleurochrysis_carterae.AAC.4
MRAASRSSASRVRASTVLLQLHARSWPRRDEETAWHTEPRALSLNATPGRLLSASTDQGLCGPG